MQLFREKLAVAISASIK